MNKDYVIYKIWVMNGIIQLVEFSVTFSSEDFPGVTSLHEGKVSIAFAELPEGANNDTIIDVLDELVEGDPHLITFHSYQLGFLYMEKTATPVGKLQGNSVTDSQIRNAPKTLFGGPTIGEIFNVN